MNVELSEEDLPLITRALEHYYAYTRAVQREDGRYRALAEHLSAPQRKPAAPEQRPVQKEAGHASRGKTRR